jgi:plasmid stability protein
MSQLTVRNVSAQLVRSLKQRAVAHGRSAEAEHREILREALLPEGEADFVSRAKALRQRLRSTVDSSELIRTDRDRDTAA